jgi:hypothetical protein
MARSQTIYLGGLGADGRADLENRVPNAIAALDHHRLVGFDHNLGAFASAFEAAYQRPLTIGRENTIQSVQRDPDLLQRVTGVLEGSMASRVREMCADDLALYEAAREKFPNLA